MLVVLLAVVCLASMSLSAMPITLKHGRCVVMFAWQKQSSNNSIRDWSPYYSLSLIQGLGDCLG